MHLNAPAKSDASKTLAVIMLQTCDHTIGAGNKIMLLLLLLHWSTSGLRLASAVWQELEAIITAKLFQAWGPMDL